MEPNPTSLNPQEGADAVKILDLATRKLAGPNADDRMYAVSVHVALQTFDRIVAENAALRQELKELKEKGTDVVTATETKKAD